MGFSKRVAVSALITALFLCGCSGIKIVKNERKSGVGVSYAAMECAAPAGGRPFAGNIPKLKNCPADNRFGVGQKAPEQEVNDNMEATEKDSLRRLVLKGLKTGFKLYNWLPMAGEQ